MFRETDFLSHPFIHHPSETLPFRFLARDEKRKTDYQEQTPILCFSDVKLEKFYEPTKQKENERTDANVK